MNTASAARDMAVNALRDNSKVSRVRRNLFGTCSDAGGVSTEEFLKTELERQRYIDMIRWTFDFEAEKPLPPIGGHHYDWQPTTVKPTVPSNATSNEENQPLLSVEKCTRNNSTDEPTEVDSDSQQTHITDFMRKRKFPSTRSQSEQKKKSPLEEEETPSKKEGTESSSPPAKIDRPSSPPP